MRFPISSVVLRLYRLSLSLTHHLLLLLVVWPDTVPVCDPPVIQVYPPDGLHGEWWPLGSHWQPFLTPIMQPLLTPITVHEPELPQVLAWPVTSCDGWQGWLLVVGLAGAGLLFPRCLRDAAFRIGTASDLWWLIIRRLTGLLSAVWVLLQLLEGGGMPAAWIGPASTLLRDAMVRLLAAVGDAAGRGLAALGTGALWGTVAGALNTLWLCVSWTPLTSIIAPAVSMVVAAIGVTVVVTSFILLGPPMSLPLLLAAGRMRRSPAPRVTPGTGSAMRAAISGAPPCERLAITAAVEAVDDSTMTARSGSQQSQPSPDSARRIKRAEFGVKPWGSHPEASSRSRQLVARLPTPETRLETESAGSVVAWRPQLPSPPRPHAGWTVIQSVNGLRADVSPLSWATGGGATLLAAGQVLASGAKSLAATNAGGGQARRARTWSPAARPPCGANVTREQAPGKWWRGRGSRLPRQTRQLRAGCTPAQISHPDSHGTRDTPRGRVGPLARCSCHLLDWSYEGEVHVPPKSDGFGTVDMPLSSSPLFTSRQQSTNEKRPVSSVRPRSRPLQDVQNHPVPGKCTPASAPPRCRQDRMEIFPLAN